MEVKKLVIIPTYNESENIREIVEEVMGLEEEFDVLVVDDNSPDGTAKKVQQVIETQNKNGQQRVFLEVRDKKNGLGAAYLHGFRWALQRTYEYVCEMDADFSHNPKDLLRLYNECHRSGADVAIGSRYIKGVNVVNWPLRRILLSRGASWYVRKITGMDIKDPTAGFVCYKRKVLQEIELDKIHLVGYAFQVEMKYKAYVRGFSLREIPIIFTDRVRGKSKMNGSIIKEAAWGVVEMKLKERAKRKI